MDSRDADIGNVKRSEDIMEKPGSESVRSRRFRVFEKVREEQEAE